MGVPSRLPHCWLRAGAAQRPVSCLLIWEMGTAAPPLAPCAWYLQCWAPAAMRPAWAWESLLHPHLRVSWCPREPRACSLHCVACGCGAYTPRLQENHFPQGARPALPVGVLELLGASWGCMHWREKGNACPSQACPAPWPPQPSRASPAPRGQDKKGPEEWGPVGMAWP